MKKATDYLDEAVEKAPVDFAAGIHTLSSSIKNGLLLRVAIQMVADKATALDRFSREEEVEDGKMMGETAQLLYQALERLVAERINRVNGDGGV